MAMAMTELANFVRQCLIQRISADEFLRLLQNRLPRCSGSNLFNILLKFKSSLCAEGDPLIPLYSESVISNGLLKISDALVVLIRKWNDSRRSKNANSSHEITESDIATLNELSLILVSPRCSIDESEAYKCLLLSSKWLNTVVKLASQDQSSLNEGNIPNLVQAIGFFLASTSATSAGTELLSQSKTPKDDNKRVGPITDEPRSSVRQAIDYCTSVFPISVQLMERLSTVQKHIAMFDGVQVQSVSATESSSEIQALQFQVSIAETQTIPSRAATTAYIETLILLGSNIDDSVVLNFLAGRYANNYASMYSDLISASFKTWKNLKTDRKSKLRREQALVFIQNKLPIILNSISASSFASFSTEARTIEAWQEISQEISDPDLPLVGSRFLQICSLYHLMSSEVVMQLVGEEQVNASKIQHLYAKDDLVSQIHSSAPRGVKLVEELMKNDGNAGVITYALIETIYHYCRTKETQYLKDLANIIVRKPMSINIMNMFIKAEFWLSPMCTLLDEWRWDEIHGESQPVYDEFGSIFLLILCTKNRLALSKSDLGIRNKLGFVAQYLEREGNEQDVNSLSEESQHHLGEWINALYIAEGLSDELTTSCSPQEFYLLVPTLLRQSVMAQQRGKLSHDTLKAGLEYLLESFLLPSLMSALSWITNIVHQSADIVPTILQVLTKQPGSVESREIHSTILAMSASKIQASFGTQSLKSLDLDLKAFDSIDSFSFDDQEEIDRTTFVGLSIFQQMVINQVTSLPNIGLSGQTISEAIYTLLQTTLYIRGPHVTLRCLIGVLLHFVGNPEFFYALDLISTLICLSDSKLRNQLRLQYNRLGPLLKKNETMYAEACVHLFRKQELYNTLLAASFATQLTNIDTTSANLDPAASLPDVNMEASQTQVDSIDQVLDEVAVLGDMDENDAINVDDFLFPDDNFGNLEDLNLDFDTEF